MFLPVAFVVLVAAACSSDGFPESFADQIDEETGLSNVEQNWLDGCTVGLADSDLAQDANSVCECSFRTLSAPGGIAFDDFIELNNDLRGDPTQLSSESPTPAQQRLTEIVRSCIASG